MKVFVDPYLNTVQDINAAYFNNEGYKTPSEEERIRIESDLAEMRIVGKIADLGCLFGLGGSYVVSHIPYVGRFLGLIGGSVSVALGILGYEMGKVADNLKIYSKESNGTKIAHSVSDITDSSVSLEKFNKSLAETATKGTFIGSTLVDFALASKNNAG